MERFVWLGKLDATYIAFFIFFLFYFCCVFFVFVFFFLVVSLVEGIG